MTHAFSSTFFGFSFWLPENFGLFYCFSVPYVHFLLPGSVFLSGFRVILDFFTAFLGFMSILNCSVPYFLWLPDDFGLFYAFSVLYVHFLLPGSVFPSGFRMILDFFTVFSALCPFSPTQFRISLWLPDNFELFYAFSVLYVHFLLPGSVFPSGFRMILDFFTVFLGFMSIFSYSAPYFLLASG